MSLTIKDRETWDLARALAAETGETMIAAVKQALRERLQRVRRRPASAAELVAIGKRCASTLKPPRVDHGALLYDERGAPR